MQILKADLFSQQPWVIPNNFKCVNKLSFIIYTISNDYTLIEVAMNFDSIGKNIRKYRLAKKLRQEDLAEKTNLSNNYIGMLERGEKIPSLETFILIANTLQVSADMLLSDVISVGYTVKNSLLNEKLSKLSQEDQARIYDVIDTLVRHSKQIKP